MAGQDLTFSDGAHGSLTITVQQENAHGKTTVAESRSCLISLETKNYRDNSIGYCLLEGTSTEYGIKSKYY